METKMNEENYRFWDTVVKFIGFMGVALSFYFSAGQFSQSMEKEYKKPFWEEQLKMCVSAVKITSKLALSQKDGKLSETLINDLFSIFYGESSLLMNHDAMKSLREMGSNAVQCNNGRLEPKECTGPRFNGYALVFSEKCRDMLIKSSDIPLESLDTKALIPVLN